MRLQALAAAARPDQAGSVADRGAIDAGAADALEAQLAAGNLYAALSLPANGGERFAGLIEMNFVPIDPQARAVVLDQRARSPRGELFQHFRELRLARRLESFRAEEAAQQLLPAHLLLREMTRGPGEALLPLRKLLLEQRRDAAADEVARQRLVRVALVFDPFEP